jgi:hypothetical protein
VANSYDERMASAWDYLKRRPDGRYAARLRRFVKRAEPVYFEVRQSTIAGLEAYLRSLPDGPHAAEALERLTTLRFERRREALDRREALATGLRLDLERTQRAEVSSELDQWLALLVRPSLWRRPLSQAPDALLLRYSLALPKPRCTRDDPEQGLTTCRKRLRRGFRVVDDGARVERTLAIELQMVLDASWKPRRATLIGPAMLVRRAEARAIAALDDDDATVHAEVTRDYLADVTEQLFRMELECNGGTDDSGVTTLVCDGVTLTIWPGGPGGDDVVAFAAPAAPAAGEAVGTP